MQYRKYKSPIISIILAFGLAACASTGTNQRTPASEEERQGIDGHEPKETKDNPKFAWLNKVEEDFGRIASETSSRTVASEKRKQLLLQNNGWVFYFQPNSNQFFVELQGRTYKMVQTSLGDGESYAFAAEGQTENPVTLSLLREQGRRIASGQSCNAELAYWNQKQRTYTKDNARVDGKSCAQLIQKLKEYIP